MLLLRIGGISPLVQEKDRRTRLAADASSVFRGAKPSRDLTGRARPGVQTLFCWRPKVGTPYEDQVYQYNSSSVGATAAAVISEGSGSGALRTKTQIHTPQENRSMDVYTSKISVEKNTFPNSINDSYWLTLTVLNVSR